MMLALLVLSGCKPEPESAVLFCASETAQLWDPADDTEAFQFPDDALTVDDPTSPTGIRVGLDINQTPWLVAMPDFVRPIANGIHRRTGFGRIGGVYLRFTDSIGALPDPASLRLVDLSVEPPEDVPYEASLFDGGRQLIVQPLRPLQAAARHAVVLTTDHVSASGGCIAPSPVLQDVLSGEAVGEGLGRVAERYAGLPDQLGIEPTDISSATVFTTHGDAAALRGITDGLRDREMVWASPPECTDWVHGRWCTGQFTAQDHRGVEDVVTAEAAGEWDLDVDIYLPAGMDGPVPVVFFGHGINSTRGEATGAARRLLPALGVAVVAVDAMEHGTHPAADPDAMDALALLGITLVPFQIDGLVLAQNFVQTSLDRLQLVSLLQQQPDVDGDGEADLDMDALGYLGISLGGLMGPGVLALGDDFSAAVLPVSGAHLGTFALENEYVAGAQELLIDLIGDEAAWQRALLVGQANLDPADPAVYAAHVLSDRLGEVQAGPDVLVQVSVFDGIVPVPTGHYLARALGVPHVPPIYAPVDALPQYAGTAPLAGNQDGGTAGFFQLDRVSVDGVVAASDHWSTPWSDEGTLMTSHFFSTWIESGRAEIVDPYAELGTPPLGGER
jgi:hypothetical protein